MISNDVDRIAQCVSDDWVLVTPEVGPVPRARIFDAIRLPRKSCSATWACSTSRRRCRRLPARPSFRSDPRTSNCASRPTLEMALPERDLIAAGRHSRPRPGSTLPALSLSAPASHRAICRFESPRLPRLDDDPDPGRVVGAWARAVMANGATECHVMPFAKLKAIRDRSPAVVANLQRTPWFTHEHEMYRKCPIRALSKSRPMSPIHSSPEALAWRERFAKAVEIEEEAELVEDAGVGQLPAAHYGMTMGSLQTVFDKRALTLVGVGDTGRCTGAAR